MKDFELSGRPHRAIIVGESALVVGHDDGDGEMSRRGGVRAVGQLNSNPLFGDRLAIGVDHPSGNLAGSGRAINLRTFSAGGNGSEAGERLAGQNV